MHSLLALALAFHTVAVLLLLGLNPQAQAFTTALLLTFALQSAWMFLLFERLALHNGVRSPHPIATKVGAVAVYMLIIGIYFARPSGIVLG